MLERITATDGVVFYHSPKLHRIGTPHGFSTRIGGVSSGPFHSLNLGNPNGVAIQDPPENVATNYSRFQSAIGCGNRERAYVHQVHGDRIARAGEAAPFDCNLKADGIICADPSKAVAVRVADCVPILLATADGRTVAAVHAGWRGVVAGIVVRAIEQLREIATASAGQQEPPIFAAIGPCISFDRFEVGPEVAAEFESRFSGDADRLLKPSRNAGKAMVDLRGALRVQLHSQGLSGDSIDQSTSCTQKDADEFFSHRRENGVTGRMAAIIGPA